MRSKTLGINVRVTATEKVIQNANFCSLSLSEYLRRLGLGKDIEATIREKDYRVFRLLKQLKSDTGLLEKDEIIRRIDLVLEELQK